MHIIELYGTAGLGSHLAFGTEIGVLKSYCEKSGEKSTQMLPAPSSSSHFKLFLVLCHFCVMLTISVIYTIYNAVAVIVLCVGQLLCVDVEFFCF